MRKFNLLIHIFSIYYKNYIIIFQIKWIEIGAVFAETPIATPSIRVPSMLDQGSLSLSRACPCLRISNYLESKTIVSKVTTIRPNKSKENLWKARTIFMLLNKAL